MADAIGQVLPLGIVVSLSPMPIIAVVLMLGTPRARVNGPAFVIGWIVALAIVGAIVLVLAGGAGADGGGEPATWVDVVKLVLGLLLLLVAVKQWRGRPREGDDAPLPKWMQAIDQFKPGRALGLAALLGGLNPKNLLLTVGAATAIAQVGIDTGEQAVALGVFVLVATHLVDVAHDEEPDSLAAEVAANLDERLGSGDVDVRHRLGVEHSDPHFLRARVRDLLADVLGVGKEQGGPPQDVTPGCASAPSSRSVSAQHRHRPEGVEGPQLGLVEVQDVVVVAVQGLSVGVGDGDRVDRVLGVVGAQADHGEDCALEVVVALDAHRVRVHAPAVGDARERPQLGLHRLLPRGWRRRLDAGVERVPGETPCRAPGRCA